MAQAAQAISEELASDRPRRTQLLLGLIEVEADRLEEAGVTLGTARQLGEALGAVWDLTLSHVAFGLRLFHLGEWDDAVVEIEASMDLASDLGVELAQPVARTVLALIALHRDDLGRAGALLDGAEAQVERGGRRGLDGLLWARALWLEARGETEAAWRCRRSAFEWMAVSGVRTMARLIGPDVVRSALASGDHGYALAATVAMEEAARRAGDAGFEASALRCRGLLDHDLDQLSAAVAACRRSGRPLELALTLEDAASLHSEEPGGQVDLLEEAALVYERLGAVRALARVEAGLRGLGRRRGRRGPRRRPAVGWGSLTPTEVRVASLVADGLSNPEIAARMFVSRRTVATHVSHALAKLGVRSRVELAARAARHMTDEHQV